MYNDLSFDNHQTVSLWELGLPRSEAHTTGRFSLGTYCLRNHAGGGIWWVLAPMTPWSSSRSTGQLPIPVSDPLWRNWDLPQVSGGAVQFQALQKHHPTCTRWLREVVQHSTNTLWNSLGVLWLYLYFHTASLFARIRVIVVSAWGNQMFCVSPLLTCQTFWTFCATVVTVASQCTCLSTAYSPLVYWALNLACYLWQIYDYIHYSSNSFRKKLRSAQKKWIIQNNCTIKKAVMEHCDSAQKWNERYRQEQ